MVRRDVGRIVVCRWRTVDLGVVVVVKEKDEKIRGCLSAYIFLEMTFENETRELMCVRLCERTRRTI